MDWKQLGNSIIKLSNEEYNNFMVDIADLKHKRNLKEYFLRLRFYSEISKVAFVLSDLEDNVPTEDMAQIRWKYMIKSTRNTLKNLEIVVLRRYIP